MSYQDSFSFGIIPALIHVFYTTSHKRCLQCQPSQGTSSKEDASEQTRREIDW